MEESLTSKSTREPSRKGYFAKYRSVTWMLPEFRGRIEYSTQESRGNTGDKHGQKKKIHDQRARSAEPSVSAIFTLTKP